MAQLLRETIPVPLEEQLAMASRMADLQWQINFTQIKLNGFRNKENDEWKHLKSLQNAAKAELKDLTTVFNDP